MRHPSQISRSDPCFPANSVAVKRFVTVDELVKSPENFCGKPYIVLIYLLKSYMMCLNLHMPTFYETVTVNQRPVVFYVPY